MVLVRLLTASTKSEESYKACYIIGHSLLAVPCFRLNTYGRRAFSVAGPYGLELSPGIYPGSYEQHRLFRHLLKTYLFARY